MPPNDSGPPGQPGEPHYQHQPPPPQRTADTPECRASGQQGPSKTLVWVPCTWAHPQDLHSQLHRRRVAAARSLPLGCGCRDPYPCRCTQPPPSAVMVDAGAAAAAHLLKLGFPPLLDIDTARALWRRGGDDRALVARLNEYGLAR
jgi:hypothetical protein